MKKLAERLQNSSNEEISELIFKNAFCSMQHAIDHYLESHPDKNNNKYTIIHIAHSLELIFKSKLAKENKFLILKNLDKIEKGTVNTEEAYLRLNKLFIIKFDKKEEKQINSIRDIRNDIEHFVFEENNDQFDKIITFIIGFWCSFVKRYLSYDLEELFTTSQYSFINQIDYEHQKILKVSQEEFDKRYLLREKVVGDKVRQEYCDNCFEEMVLLDLDLGTAVCYYCGEEYDVGNCDECGNHDIIKTGYDEYGFCGNCSRYPDEDWKIWADR